MTEEEIKILNKKVRKRFPEVNCHMHCVIMQNLLNSKGIRSDIMHNSNHSILYVSQSFDLDKHRDTILDISTYKGGNYYHIDFFGLDVIMNLLSVNLNKEQERVSTAIEGNELYAFHQTNT